MKSCRFENEEHGSCRRRVSLEQKIRLLVRRYRQAERRKKKRQQERDTKRHHRRNILVFAVLLALVGWIVLAHSQARPVSAALDQGHPDSASGKTSEAVQHHQAAIARRGYSASGLFNLANAWLREGKVGEAILNYERALWLAPNDPAVVRNLQIARQTAGLSAPALHGLEKVARVAPPNTLARVGSAALALMALWVLAGRLLPLKWQLPAKWLALSSLVVWLLSVGNLGYWWNRVDRAVVLETQVPVTIAPAHAASVSFELREGEIVHTRRFHGEFVAIRTHDGRTGWLDRRSIARIVPAKYRLNNKTS